MAIINTWLTSIKKEVEFIMRKDLEPFIECIIVKEGIDRDSFRNSSMLE